MSYQRASLVVAVALLVAACTGPSLDDLIQSADSLSMPAGWEFVAEEVADRPCPDPVENCPRVDRTYQVPGAVDFAAVVVPMLENAGFEVWNPPGNRCGSNPEQGCNAGARRDEVSIGAVVVEVLPASYVVNVRTSEYVGP